MFVSLSFFGSVYIYIWYIWCWCPWIRTTCMPWIDQKYGGFPVPKLRPRTIDQRKTKNLYGWTMTIPWDDIPKDEPNNTVDSAFLPLLLLLLLLLMRWWQFLHALICSAGWCFIVFFLLFSYLSLSLSLCPRIRRRIGSNGDGGDVGGDNDRPTDRPTDRGGCRWVTRLWAADTHKKVCRTPPHHTTLGVFPLTAVCFLMSFSVSCSSTAPFSTSNCPVFCLLQSYLTASGVGGVRH